MEVVTQRGVLSLPTAAGSLTPPSSSPFSPPLHSHCFAVLLRNPCLTPKQQVLTFLRSQLVEPHGADPGRVLGGIPAWPEALLPRRIELLCGCSADEKQSPNDRREIAPTHRQERPKCPLGGPWRSGHIQGFLPLTLTGWCSPAWTSSRQGQTWKADVLPKAPGPRRWRSPSGPPGALPTFISRDRTSETFPLIWH